MTTMASGSALDGLAKFISAKREHYDACFDKVEHAETIAGISCVTRMHHLRFNPNGQPKVEELCDCLVQHIIHYCLNARTRPSPLNEFESVKFTQRARKLFIRKGATPDDPDETGQAGELLLYFLLETVLGAPQIVAKMDLKTNPNLEVFGSDGIHMAWDEAEQIVNLYFGEAKVYQNIGAAITNALTSVEKFHANDMRRHECSMVTAHFKYANAHVQTVVADILDNQIPDVGVRLNHAFLIGYNWDAFSNLPPTPAALNEEFRKRYLADAPRIHGLLRDRLDSFTRKELHLNVLFVPFRSVQEFRDAFNRALS